MGAAISTNTTTINTDLSSSVYNKCEAAKLDNTFYGSGLHYDQPETCPKDSKGFLVEQAVALRADCTIKTLQDSTAEAIAKQSATAQAGLGIAVSTNVSDIRNSISQNLEQTCGGSSTTNKVGLTDTYVRACNLVVIQNATANESCKLDALQKLAAVAETGQEAESVGLFGGLGVGGLIGIIIAVVIVIAAAGGMYYYITRTKKGNEHYEKYVGRHFNKQPEQKKKHKEHRRHKKGGWKSEKSESLMGPGGLKENSYSVLIIIILIAIIFFIMCSTNGEQAVSQTDMKKLNNSIKEAYQIADFNKHKFKPKRKMLRWHPVYAPTYLDMICMDEVCDY